MSDSQEEGGGGGGHGPWHTAPIKAKCPMSETRCKYGQETVCVKVPVDRAAHAILLPQLICAGCGSMMKLFTGLGREGVEYEGVMDEVIGDRDELLEAVAPVMAPVKPVMAPKKKKRVVET